MDLIEGNQQWHISSHAPLRRFLRVPLSVALRICFLGHEEHYIEPSLLPIGMAEDLCVFRAVPVAYFRYFILLHCRPLAGAAGATLTSARHPRDLYAPVHMAIILLSYISFRQRARNRPVSGGMF